MDANDLTQGQLAERCQVSQQTVSKWIAGTVTPRAARLRRLEALFRAPDELVQLLETDGPLDPPPVPLALAAQDVDLDDPEIAAAVTNLYQVLKREV